MTGTESVTSCPLCSSVAVQFYTRDARRKYYSCACCRLVFVPRQYHLSLELERAEYDKHENSASDPGYRKFLSRVISPLKIYLKEGDTGLDFGCGPGPAAATMLSDNKINLVMYDPYYANDTRLLKKPYDFVIATEVVEHFCRPYITWKILFDCVKPGGVLGVMTKLVINLERFNNWHYKNDPTHVSFYSLATLEWVAQQWGCELECVADDAFIFKKNSDS